MASSAGRWSEINQDILIQIINHLVVLDFLRAAAVCKRWRSTIIKNPKFCRPKPSKFPWLMLSRPNESESCDFCSFTNPTSRLKFDLPNLKNHTLLGTSEGYFISLDELANIHATNPLTGDRILLPKSTTLAHYDSESRKYCSYSVGHNEVMVYPSETFRLCFCDSVVLSPPSYGSIAVLVYNRRKSLAFARESDDSWTAVTNTFMMSHIINVIFHKGLLYAVNWDNELVAFDMVNFSATSKPVIYLKKDMAINFSINIERKYLVESICGSDLFLISRYNSTTKTPIENGKRFCYFGTCYFDVFKLDRINCKWTEVKSFGDDDVAVLVGYNSAVMLSTRDSSNGILKKNFIYFSDIHKFELVYNPEKCDMRVFSMDDGAIAPLDASDDDIKLTLSPPTWFDTVVS